MQPSVRRFTPRRLNRFSGCPPEPTHGEGRIPVPLPPPRATPSHDPGRRDRAITGDRPVSAAPRRILPADAPLADAPRCRTGRLQGTLAYSTLRGARWEEPRVGERGANTG